MLLPPLITKANPRAAYIVPKVAIIEGILSLTTISPFKSPIALPTTVERIIENQRGIDRVTKRADSIPVRPKTLPMDKSKLPEIIKGVTAQPVITTKATCRITLLKFVKVRNDLDKKERTITISNKTPTITIFCKKLLLSLIFIINPLSTGNNV